MSLERRKLLGRTTQKLGQQEQREAVATGTCRHFLFSSRASRKTFFLTIFFEGKLGFQLKDFYSECLHSMLLFVFISPSAPKQDQSLIELSVQNQPDLDILTHTVLDLTP